MENKKTFVRCVAESGLIIIAAFITAAIILSLIYLVEIYGHYVGLPLIIIITWLILSFTQWIKQ